MRVFELAKQLSITSKDLISDLKGIGVTVSNHMAALEDDTVAKILAKAAGKAKKPVAAALVKPPKTIEAAKPAKERDHTAALKAKKTPPPIVEPPRAEKKMILVKRRPSETPMVGDVAPLQPVEEPAAISVGPADPSKVAAPPSPRPVHAKPSSHPPRPGAVEPTIAGPPGSPASLPPQVTLPPQPPLSASGIDRQPTSKKGLPPDAPQADLLGLKDKVKKLRRVGRGREEEPIPTRDDAARWRDLRAMPMHRREEKTRHAPSGPPAEVTKPRLKAVKLSEGLTVKDFAEALGQKPAEVIRKLMDMGSMLTLNQSISPDAATLVAESFGVKVEMTAERPAETLLQEPEETEDARVPRPPVVTIMGHVDHGKTSLLDAIRQTKVTEQEAGGITQHIGAYTVRVHDKRITFLDTPGHEAFTAMRARGAKITDIVVLVVAADDGVMPQTVEAIDHAAAANVPVIVAINKIDKAGANPDRVKHALAERNLIPEAWGGQTIVVEVSAKQKVGLESLLEMILLQSEVLELKTDSRRPAKGAVVEAKLDRGRGPVATVLVQSGTLRVGDAFVVGTFSGRVRGLLTDTGQKVSEATPSMPVEVVGLPGVPAAGDLFVVVKDESVAREIAEDRLGKQRSAELAAGSARVTLEDLYARIKEGAVKELAVLIKSDVQGSAEALSEAVEKLSTAAVKLRVIHSGVGGITETDVLLASASGAIIIGFNIRPEPKAAALAEHEGVDVRLYTIIYDAIADIKAAMEGLLEPTYREQVLGRVEVREIFNIHGVGVIAGSYVLDGTISRASAGVRVVRDHVIVYEGRLGSLRRFKDDVREVQQGYECGIGVENFNDIKAGDIIEAYAVDKIAAKL